MTESNNSGAPHAPFFDTNWNQLNWPSIEKSVYRLQMRIAKAVCNKQHGRVKSLQWLLVNSVHAKLLAVKRVTTAKGSRTPGIDGVTWTDTKEKIPGSSQPKG